MEIKNKFVCTICGVLNHVENKAARHMRYCKECHNHYQKMRRKVIDAGRVFNMEGYKRLRVKLGLPVAKHSPKRGRPMREEVTFFPCRACQVEKAVDFDEHPDYNLVCKGCGYDFEQHQAMLNGLTLPWYLFFRTTPRIDETGREGMMLDPFYSDTATINAIKGEHIACQQLINKWKTLDNLMESMYGADSDS